VLWILIPIAIVIIAIVIAFPLWFTHRRMRHDHDLASAEQYLEQIGKSHEDADFGHPAPPSKSHADAALGRTTSSEQDTGVPAGAPRPRGRHAAPEVSPDQGTPSGSAGRG
jgi:nitrogen fixation-related uncharacterized protein